MRTTHSSLTPAPELTFCQRSLVADRARPLRSACADTCAICRNKLYEPSIEAQASALPPRSLLLQQLRPRTLCACMMITLTTTLHARGGAAPRRRRLSLPPSLPAHPHPRVPPPLADPGIVDDAGYSIAWGCCGHVFHLDCISRWLKTRSVCPLCNREWEFAKIEKIATYGNLD